MKIGIFTDTYRPSVNGIVYVTEILRNNLEQLGHEVFIFAPAASLSGKTDDPHIIRFPAVSGIPFDDFNASLFFPPRVLKKIEDLELDVLHFLTPGMVGLMALHAGSKLHKPVVAEYCTDLFEYVEHYALAMPSLIALGAILPFTFKPSREELLDMFKAARPRLGVANWNREMVKNMINVMHAHCSAVIAHSRKSAIQLESWQDEADHYDISIVPTGIDPVPGPSAAELAAFKKEWGITKEDEVVLYLGRLSPEKNLDLLIDMVNELVKWRPNAKLMYVGDFAEYRPKLEEEAKASPAADRIIFTGKMPRENINVAYAAADVFAFPSLTDTQSLTLHEATLAGLPVVMMDEPVTEVVKDGVNGYFCKNDPIDMAAKICDIFEDPALRKKMSKASRTLALPFSELKQTKKIEAIYDTIVRANTSTDKTPRN